MRASVALLICFAGSCSPLIYPRTALAQQIIADSERVERLVSLGRLWATLKYVHPFLASQGVAWDSALVATIPRVRSAKTSQEFAAALQRMLDVLHDPVTRVQGPQRAALANQADPDPHGRRLEGNTWLLSLRQYGDLQNFEIVDRIVAQFDSIRASRALIIDLRTDETGDDPTAMSILGYTGLDRLLASRPIHAPAQRGRYQSGFIPSVGPNPGYTAGFYTEAGDWIEPAETTFAKPVVFIVNQYSLLPPIALALQDAHLGWIVGQGRVSDGPAVSKLLLSLSDSILVGIRATELVHPDGSVGFEPDTVVAPSSGSDAPLQVALALTRSPPGRAKKRLPLPATEPAPPDSAYPNPPYPELPYRLLAAYRMWAVMELFYPYRNLTGENPTAVLRAFVPRLEQVSDSLEYNLTVAEMWTHIHDSHGFVSAPVLNAYRGIARAPVLLRSIEGKPVVTAFFPDSVARGTGIRIGDVVLSMDGEPVARRLSRLRRITAASTPEGLERNLMGQLLRGPDSSRVRVTVQGAHGRIRTVTLPRDRRFQPPSVGVRTGPIITRYPGGIGYVDLDRLTADMVDSMFQQLAETRVIIFDMRGYPNGTAWSIAPRLTERVHLPVARFTRMQPMLRDTADRTLYSFVQTLPLATGPHYRGRTVMLIDERTQSQAEHTGLFFRTAGGTTFIGSPTAGANGDVVALTVPGGISLYFSGQGVTWMDGTQLQRVGLRPDVTVRPTIAGIRAGRDEVLLRALRWARSH